MGYHKEVYCKDYMDTKRCQYGKNCNFAHGLKELRGSAKDLIMYAEHGPYPEHSPKFYVSTAHIEAAIKNEVTDMRSLIDKTIAWSKFGRVATAPCITAVSFSDLKGYCKNVLKGLILRWEEAIQNGAIVVSRGSLNTSDRAGHIWVGYYSDRALKDSGLEYVDADPETWTRLMAVNATSIYSIIDTVLLSSASTNRPVVDNDDVPANATAVYTGDLKGWCRTQAQGGYCWFHIEYAAAKGVLLRGGGYPKEWVGYLEIHRQGKRTAPVPLNLQPVSGAEGQGSSSAASAPSEQPPGLQFINHVSSASEGRSQAASQPAGPATPEGPPPGFTGAPSAAMSVSALHAATQGGRALPPAQMAQLQAQMAQQQLQQQQLQLQAQAQQQAQQAQQQAQQAQQVLHAQQAQANAQQQARQQSSAPPSLPASSGASQVTTELSARHKGAWSELSAREQESARILGWCEAGWNAGVTTHACSQPFQALSPEEQQAALQLGYTEEEWEQERTASLTDNGTDEAVEPILPPNLSAIGSLDALNHASGSIPASMPPELANMLVPTRAATQPANRPTDELNANVVAAVKQLIRAVKSVEEERISALETELMQCKILLAQRDRDRVVIQRMRGDPDAIKQLPLDELDRLVRETSESLTRMQVIQAEERSRSTLCIVCMEANRSIVFVPCGHVQCCVKCGDSMRVCPICRTTIDQRVPAFF